MKFRQLGHNGFDVSEVGLGTWQIGADWGQSFSEDKAFEILTAAVASGTSFFDTADVYGNGQSESFIGQFLKHCDKPIKVATKFGRGADVFPASYSKDAMRSAIENSLKRLDVTSLDLLQLHCIPTIEMQKGDVFDWLRDFKREGLINSFGASVESVEEGLLCMQQEGIQSLQIIFNLFRQKLLTELLPVAEQKGVGLIVRLPLASGLLSGKFTKQTQFNEQDHRNFNRDGQAFNVGETFAGLPFEKGVELADMLKAYLPAEMTMAQFAQRWILDHQAVTTIIPGASSPEQAFSNACVSDLASLPQALHDKLYQFYQSQVHDAVRGTY